MSDPICRWCGKAYDAHAILRPKGAPQPRMPCAGLRSGFMAKPAAPSNKHTDSCLQKAGDAEPIFVLRAQDQLAPLVIRHWAKLAAQAGTPDHKLREAHRCADDMLAWQEKHGAKRPD